MDWSVLKTAGLFLPVIAYIVWEIVKLSRDDELESGSSDERSVGKRASARPAGSAESRHSERQ